MMNAIAAIVILGLATLAGYLTQAFTGSGWGGIAAFCMVAFVLTVMWQEL